MLIYAALIGLALSRAGIQNAYAIVHNKNILYVKLGSKFGNFNSRYYK